MTPIERSLLFVAVFCAGIMLTSGDRPGPNPNPDPKPAPTPNEEIPIADAKFHCVFVRELGDRLSEEMAEVVNSQKIEDEARENGGVYAVYWDNTVPEAILPEHRDVVKKMIDQDGLPRWCICDGTTKMFEIGVPPNSVETAIKAIRRTRGAL